MRDEDVDRRRNAFVVQPRYGRSNYPVVAGLNQYGSAGHSALDLYTNKTSSSCHVPLDSVKSSLSYSHSDYSTSALSSLNSFSGSDYSSKSYMNSLSSATKSYNLGSDYSANHRSVITNSSRIPSVNSSSFSSGSSLSRTTREDSSAKLQASPKSSYTQKYLSYSRSSRSVSSFCSPSNNTNQNNASANINNNSQPTQSSNESSSHQTAENKSKIGKAPADYTSDSEESSSGSGSSSEINSQQNGNAQFTSRATSPHHPSSAGGRKSTESFDFISATEQIFRPKKIIFGMSVKKISKETQVSDSPDSVTDSQQPVRLEEPQNRASEEHLSAPPVRLRYGVTSNHRVTGAHHNRFSMPVIKSCYPFYTSYNTTNNRNQLDDRFRCQSPRSTTQNHHTEPPEQFQDKNEIAYDEPSSKGYNNNQKPKSSMSCNLQPAHINSRSSSPHIVKRSSSRGRSLERARNSSGETLDKELLSTDSDEEEAERKRSRRRRRRRTQEIDLSADNDQTSLNVNDSEEVPSNQDLPARSASAEPVKDVEKKEENSYILIKSVSNVTLNTPKIIKKPVNFNLNVTKPNQDSSLKDCDCDASESDFEKLSPVNPIVKIRLTPSPDSNFKADSDTDTCSDITEYENNCISIKKLNGHNFVRKSPTVIEINNNNSNKDMNLTQKSSSIGISKNNENEFENESNNFQQRKPFISPFPKESDDIIFAVSRNQSSARDSGFSESSARPDSPYDNIPTDSSRSLSDSDSSSKTSKNQIDKSNEVDDIDAFLLESFESFEDFERKMNSENKQQLNSVKNESPKEFSSSIYKCQELDEMIDSALDSSLYNSYDSLPKVIEEDNNFEDSIAVDASAVKVHHTKPMQSTVELYTEEIDESAVRIRENKALSSQLSQVTEEIVEDHVKIHPSQIRNQNVNQQNNFNEKKAWMLSVLNGKNADTSFSKQLENIQQTNHWSSNEFNKPPAHDAKFSITNGSVKSLQNRILRSHEPLYYGNQRAMNNLKNEHQSNLKNSLSHGDQIQWDHLTNSLSRPLLINDLDFTDLRDDDDADICAATDVCSTPPPPPPMPFCGTPPLPSCATPPPPPPPPSCATPPPPPMPPSASPTPPPPPPRIGMPFLWNQRQQNSPSPTPSEISKTIAKNKKTLKLFWKEVKEDKSLLSRIMKKKTIWDEIKTVAIDTQKLEHLFENRAKELGNKKTQDSSKKNEIVVLDTKRSNAINIGMTKLPPPRTIKTAIFKMDSTIMNREGIEKILTTMMPTEEEKTKITEARLASPDIPLGSAESFLLTLASISALEARLRLWAFRLDYDIIEREVAEPLMDLKHAIAEIEKCETFKIILGTLLTIGNFLNGVEAKGFQIEYLAKVPEVKDTVNKHSLLHHLCHTIIEKYPNSTDLYSELGAVSRASKVDFDELARNLQKMESECKASWDYLKVIGKYDGTTTMRVRMSEFLADCAERIIVLGIIHRRVLNRFKKLLVFLGLPRHTIKETKPHQILKVISEFALEYRTTRERVRDALEKKALQKERLKAKQRALAEAEKAKPNKENRADRELKQLLINGYSDYESESSSQSGNKWSTLPGTKLRRPSAGSMQNLTQVGISNRNQTFRHSVNIETYTGEDNEILECLVKTATAPVKTEPRSRNKKPRFGDKQSLRRTLKSGLDLTEEERLMLATMST